MAMGAVRAITGGTNGATAANLLQPLSTETVQPFDKLILHVKNASGSVVTVTVTDPGTTAAGSAASNPTFTVPATTGDVYYYVDSDLMNPNTGVITVGFSATTSVTAEWLRA
jgi:hypothetical protein